MPIHSLQDVVYVVFLLKRGGQTYTNLYKISVLNKCVIPAMHGITVIDERFFYPFPYVDIFTYL